MIDRTQSHKTVLVLDVATSGYSPDNDVILEIAGILVDTTTLDVIDTFTHLVALTVELPKLPKFHEALAAECRAPGMTTLRQVEGMLLAGPWTGASAVCNRALDFDLKFIQKHMPTLARALPRLQVELKTLELLLTARGVPAYVPESRSMRASDDAIAAYNELTHFLTTPPSPK